MRKIAMSLAVIMLLVMPVTLHAANVRIIRITPNLVFEGENANCSVIVISDSSDDEVEATIKLWQGSKCVATWQEESAG